MKEAFKNLNKYLKDKELAKIAGTTERTIYNWKKKDSIPNEKLKQLHLFLKNEKKININILKKSLELDNFQDIYKEILLRGRGSARDCSIDILNGTPWKIAYFNFVDDFRNTLRMELVEDPPIQSIDLKYIGLINATVFKICNDNSIIPPKWCTQKIPLKNPWFISGLPSIRKYELLEAFPEFKRNNIFCTKKFLSRY